MMPTRVIHRPLITEKNTFLADAFNRYGFEVDSKATKSQIKNAVQTMYSVRVLEVATQNRRGRTKRNKFGPYVHGAHKRALVKVHPDDKIDLF